MLHLLAPISLVTLSWPSAGWAINNNEISSSASDANVAGDLPRRLPCYHVVGSQSDFGSNFFNPGGFCNLGGWTVCFTRRRDISQDT